MLSLKCPNCGGVVFFTEENIATHCSFCGTPLPDMKDYVVKAAEMQLKEKEHKMEVEKINLDTRRIQRRNRALRIVAIELTVAFLTILVIFGGIIWLIYSIRHH